MFAHIIRSARTADDSKVKMSTCIQSAGITQMHLLYAHLNEQNMRRVAQQQLLSSDICPQEVTPLRTVAREEDKTATTSLQLN